MWRVISLLLLLLGLAGYSFADDVIDNKCWSYTGVPPSAPNGGGSSLGYMKVPGTNVYENAYTCNAESPRITRFYGDAIYSCPSGTSDVNGVCKNTRPTCSMSNIAARCAAKKGWGLAMSDISSSSMCGIPSAPATMPDDCDPPPGVGCSMTARFNPLGPPLYMDYTGFTCTATAQVADPSNPNSGNMPALPQPLPQSPGNCKSDEYWGTVSANGKTLQGCFGAGPIPSSNAPVADPATGKDANGNCAANYIGTIDSTGAFKCYPNTQPDSNANCPDGWNKIPRVNKLFVLILIQNREALVLVLVVLVILAVTLIIRVLALPALQMAVLPMLPALTHKTPANALACLTGSVI
ncbi:hypothetical protein [Aquitalea magnusonii]|uniref:hypothetical protein n=1 Tax=Aquitalea magnusonii TaxID=332411 RepID=UPI00128F20EE|nr:hypothetical protein [Aquitalea magnusonii]